MTTASTQPEASTVSDGGATLRDWNSQFWPDVERWVSDAACSRWDAPDNLKRLDSLLIEGAALCLASRNHTQESALSQTLGDAGPGRTAVKNQLKANKRTIAQARRELEQEQRAIDPQAVQVYRYSKPICPPLDHWAARLIRSEHEFTLASHSASIWRYRKDVGYWIPLEEKKVRRIALDMLTRIHDDEGSYLYGGATDVSLTVQSLDTILDAHPLGGDKPPAVVVFTDGTFNVHCKLLQPHSPHFGATFAINAPFDKKAFNADPDADITTILPEVFIGFVDRCYGIEALPIIRALVRCVIDPTIESGKAWHLLGESHSGKGLLLNFVCSILPLNLVASLKHPAELCDTDKLYQKVLGKRLLAFGDCPPRTPRHLDPHFSLWYSLVTNEPVTIRRLKASDTTTARMNTVSIIASTKQLQLGDGRDGYISRVLTLPTLPRTGEVDPALKKALLGDTDAHHALRGAIASWALAMPIDELQAVIRRDDPAGILRDTADDLAREADHPSRWADAFLIPATKPGSKENDPNAPVTQADWQTFFNCYLKSCEAQNIRHEGTLDHFIGQIRTVLGTKRCLPRSKGPRPERRNLPRFDAGFCLRSDVADSAFSFRLDLAGFDGLAQIAALPQAERPDDQKP